MGNLKVLKLDRWMQDRRDRNSCVRGSKDYRPMKPVVGRPGRYLKDGKAWFEADGKAWTCPAEMFNWEMKTLEAERLNARQVQALQAVCDQKLATRGQREMLYMHNHYLELREIRRGVYYFMIRNKEAL